MQVGDLVEFHCTVRKHDVGGVGIILDYDADRDFGAEYHVHWFEEHNTTLREWYFEDEIRIIKKSA
jgi:hypothetical protein